MPVSKNRKGQKAKVRQRAKQLDEQRYSAKKKQEALIEKLQGEYAANMRAQIEKEIEDREKRAESTEKAHDEILEKSAGLASPMEDLFPSKK